ncbi:hypothetical protein [Tabrizicola sp. YIM 78059]|uniref:hypothetical protein n=1 Tax=Tabrizicola sp. YIM 78059 TaxID=2529861 RepID=UPI0010AAD85C|nr:hypothetical protein [Tabrizicola sp. YIM 78059]
MRQLILALPVLMAACVAPGTPQPQAARLSAEALTLTLSDGTICRARWAEAGGVGRMDDCGPGYGYSVRVVENPNVLRQLWTGLTGALGAEGAVPPMAEVVITDAMGRDHVFVSPPPRD